jgi:hypothetical protein
VYSEQSVQFGIAADDVVAISLVGKDGVVTPALLRDGTFAAKINNGEVCGSPDVPGLPPGTNNLVRATLKNGRVVEGPLCKPLGAH